MTARAHGYRRAVRVIEPHFETGQAGWARQGDDAQVHSCARDEIEQMASESWTHGFRIDASLGVEARLAGACAAVALDHFAETMEQRLADRVPRGQAVRGGAEQRHVHA